MEETQKTCTGCGETKPIGDYFLDKRRMKPRARCKDCASVWMKDHYSNNKAYYSDFARKWRAKNRVRANETSNRSRAKRRLSVHAAWLAHQGGRCVICLRGQTDPLAMHLDHCHRTGAVRGLLCKRCNYLLGNADDDEAVLLAAVEYLRQHPVDLSLPKDKCKSAWWKSLPPP